ncbi:PIN domain-containing protein [Mucilaginibacter arboris]|uniref:PIN domain-containing protein n=1 Tax=Mucilaginibacter arboris TaxID=2682090 RepID=A0A7K1SS69_9SPHI|nr:PIN domain-containing protein [Mucilaginibacter arboris]MVN20153.1 PIN domain-containing protein [Mucilaginibacter arboris]
MNNIFVDSNIVLYLMDVDEHKKIISRKLLSNNPTICTQVLTEVANVCKYRFKYKKHELLILWSDLLRDCTLIPTDHQSVHKAIQLVELYDFQLFDALIIADALKANCTILYSEDMQHKMLLENKLTIINPFL